MMKKHHLNYVLGIYLIGVYTVYIVYIVYMSIYRSNLEFSQSILRWIYQKWKSVLIRRRLARCKNEVYFEDIYVRELEDNYYRFPGPCANPRDDPAVHLLLGAELLACYLLWCFVLRRESRSMDLRYRK